MTRRKPLPKRERVAAALFSAQSPPSLPIPGKDPFWRSILTDHNGDFDMGAVLVGFVTIAMCLISGYDVIGNHVKFNPQEFGTGIGAVLVGFAAYKWGDARRVPPGTTTTTAIQTTSTAGPPALGA